MTLDPELGPQQPAEPVTSEMMPDETVSNETGAIPRPRRLPRLRKMFSTPASIAAGIGLGDC